MTRRILSHSDIENFINRCNRTLFSLVFSESVLVGAIITFYKYGYIKNAISTILQVRRKLLNISGLKFEHFRVLIYSSVHVTIKGKKEQNI